jgi:hypothetical protein
MLASINPVVYRGSRRRTAQCMLLHLIGGALGGALIVVGLAWIASPVRYRHGVISLALAAALAAAALLMDTGIFPWRTPSPNRQVPASWRRRLRPQLCALAYGIGLGLAVTTRVRFALTYAVFGISVIMLSPVGAVVPGLLFGAARSAIVLAGIGAGTHEQLTRRLERVSAAESMAQIVVIVTSGFLLVTLAALAWKAA